MKELKKSKKDETKSTISKVIEEFYFELQSHENETLNMPRIEPVVYPGLKKIIEIKHLVKEFKTKKKKFKAVDDLNLTIYKNQNVALLGGNGAGKTTTVEMLVGINKPTKGEIKYYFDENPNVETKLDSTLMGIQFQDSSYPQGLTVNDVITSVNQIYGQKIKGKELEYLNKIFGIDEFITNKAASLSGGQHQRLNALLGIIHRPKFIILDELSTGLDIKIKSRLMHFIKNFVKENDSTLLIVSHDINEIEVLTDRIVILNKGKVVYDKSKEASVKEYGSLKACLNHFI